MKADLMLIQMFLKEDFDSVCDNLDEETFYLLAMNSLVFFLCSPIIFPPK
jgi:hypothetical protein